MPIQLPEIKRSLEAPAPASAGRIEGGIQDTSSVDAAITEGAVKVMNEGFELHARYKKQAIDDEANKAVLEYEQWYRLQTEGDSKNGIIGVDHKEGDPTPLYNDLDKRAEEKYKAIVGKETISSEARPFVEKRLASKHNQLYSTRLVSYGNRKAKFDGELRDALIESDKKAAIDASKLLDMEDPSSFTAFEETLNNAADHLIEHAEKYGDAVKSPNGKRLYFDKTAVNEETGELGKIVKVDIGQPTKIQIAKVQNEIFTETVTNLISDDEPDSKKIKTAKHIMKVYESYIDGGTKAKLNEKISQKDTEAKAYDLLGQLAGRPYSEQRQLLKGMKAEPKVKEMALQKLINVERNDDNLKDLASENARDYAMNVAMKFTMNPDAKMPANEQGVYDLKIGNMKMGTLIDNIPDPKHKKEVIEMFIQSKEDNEQQVDELIESVESGEFFKKSYAQVQPMLSGLKTETRRFWQKKHMDYNDPNTDAQDRASTTHAVMLMKNMIKPQMKFNPDGSLKPRSRKIYNEALAEITENPPPKGMDPAQYVRNVISKHTMKNREAQQSAPGVYVSPTATPSTPKKSYSSLPTPERQKIIEDFKAANPNKTPTLKDVKDWYDKQ